MVSTKTWFQVAGGVVLAALVTAAFLQGRAAESTWTANDPVGECGTRALGGDIGHTSGGEVLAVQNVLSATHGLQAADNTWDADTAATVRAFQAWTGLPVDGCVNTNTWVTMRVLVVPVCAPEYSCQGPDQLLRWGPARDPRDAWFLDANCGWASWVLPDAAQSPVAPKTPYQFSRNPLAELRCEG
jgi:peptidoglycan hydrolase-like protein with peptidoglycan-binding domain